MATGKHAVVPVIERNSNDRWSWLRCGLVGGRVCGAGVGVGLGGVVCPSGGQNHGVRSGSLSMVMVPAAFVDFVVVVKAEQIKVFGFRLAVVS